MDKIALLVLCSLLIKNCDTLPVIPDDTKRKSWIYIIICKTTGKVYVGQSVKGGKYRWNQHVSEANHPEANQSRHLNNAIIAYGKDDFVVYDIWECDVDDVDYWEQFFIYCYDSCDNGYNLTYGGGVNHEKSQETLERSSKAHKGLAKKAPTRYDHNGNVLPKYVRLYNGKDAQGYKIADHPALNGKSIASTSGKKSMDEKLAESIKIVEGLDDGTYIPAKIVTATELPKGIVRVQRGYEVHVEGHPVKSFHYGHDKIGEKLAKAIAHLNSIKTTASLSEA